MGFSPKLWPTRRQKSWWTAWAKSPIGFLATSLLPMAVPFSYPAKLRRGKAFAHKFVALKRGGNLECLQLLVRTRWNAIRPQNFTNAAQIHGLRALVIQSDDVLNGPPQIWLAFRGEQDAARADVPGIAREGNAISAGTGD